MLESNLDELAIELDTAVTPLQAGKAGKTGKCGCHEPSLSAGGDGIALPATMPSLQTLSTELETALADGLAEGGPDELLDEMGETPVSLDDLLHLLRQNPGLKLHLSF